VEHHSATCLYDNTDTRGIGRGRVKREANCADDCCGSSSATCHAGHEHRGVVAHRVGASKWCRTVQPAYTTTRIQRGLEGGRVKREANCADDCCGSSSATCHAGHEHRGVVAHRVGGSKWCRTVQPAYTTTQTRGETGRGRVKREANCADDCCGRSRATCNTDTGGWLLFTLSMILSGVADSSVIGLYENTDKMGIGRGEGEERGELRRRLLREKQVNLQRGTRGGGVRASKWCSIVQPAYTTTRIRAGGGSGRMKREANCADDC